ncbi:hypothetical protein AB0880_10465 [Micromonospora chersina]|uniref:hypothetical protein n=1 Tax=Micromonospora chersina TaxID=47854 RepID=UPI00345732DB
MSMPQGPMSYRGGQLAGTPLVAAVLERAPRVLLPIARPDLPETALRREDLCEFLYLGTGDGLTWVLSLGDEVKPVVDAGCDLLDDDLIGEALAAQPDVDEVWHVDREVFEVSLSHALPADEVFARWLDAIVTAHRQLASRRGIQLPY